MTYNKAKQQLLPTASTWVLSNGSQLRPGPPPDYNSAEMAAQVSQLNFARTTGSNTAVYHRASVFVYGLWGDIDEKVFVHGLATNPPRGTGHALSSVAQYDALIACRDSKYTYREMRPFQMDPAMGTQLGIGGIWGSVTAGQTWLAPDAQRFILLALSNQVVYCLEGKFYRQTARGFVGEVTTYPYYKAGKNALWLATVAEVEVRIVRGVIAGSSGVGFAVVVGTEVLEFVVENRENFAIWRRVLSAVLEVRTILKKVAPTLYSNVVDCYSAAGRTS